MPAEALPSSVPATDAAQETHPRSYGPRGRYNGGANGAPTHGGKARHTIEVHLKLLHPLRTKRIRLRHASIEVPTRRERDCSTADRGEVLQGGLVPVVFPPRDGMSTEVAINPPANATPIAPPRRHTARIRALPTAMNHDNATVSSDQGHVTSPLPRGGALVVPLHIRGIVGARSGNLLQEDASPRLKAHQLLEESSDLSKFGALKVS